MRILIAGALGVLLACSIAVGAPLDFEALASKTRRAEIDPDDFSKGLARIPSGIAFQSQPDAQLEEHYIAGVWIQCNKKGAECRPSLTEYHLVDEPDDAAREKMHLQKLTYEVIRQVLLPVPVKPFVALGFRPLAVSDLVGDGKRQVVVRYEVEAPPRPGLGSLTYEYLAIVNRRDLSIALFQEIGRGTRPAGAGSCSYSVESVDLDGDKLKDLRFSGSCGPTETYLFRAKSRRYEKGAATPERSH